MEVEQVSFDRERLVAKRWPQSHVGDGIKSLIVHAGAREIHAVTRNQIVIAAQIDGWDGVFVAITASATWSARNAKDAAQQSPRHAHLALQQEPAYLAAGNRNSTDHHYRIDAHIKTKLLAQIFQARGSALGVMTKVKIIAFVHFLRVQPAGKNIARKLFRRGHGKITGKRNFQQRVQSSLGQQCFLLRQRRNQTWRHVRTQNAERMRLKGHRNGLAMVLSCALGHFFQNAQVPAMDPIKIPYAQNRWSKICGHFFQRAEYSHAIWNSSFSPSCARRTCSGRFLLVSRCGKSWEI